MTRNHNVSDAVNDALVVTFSTNYSPVEGTYKDITAASARARCREECPCHAELSLASDIRSSMTRVSGTHQVTCISNVLGRVRDQHLQAVILEWSGSQRHHW